jgi:dihydrofolate reductase
MRTHVPLALIVAMAKNHVIGIDNDLPWHIPADLKRFKELTKGKPCIMGRNTFESIFNRIKKPLPDRPNIVISKSGFTADDVETLTGLDEAITQTRAKYPETEIMIIGGASVYAQAIDTVDRLYLTIVDIEPDGDAFFPEINYSEWKLVSEETLHDPMRYKNLVLERI